MKNIKKIAVTALIALCSLSLTGCGGKEPNEIAYVVALGIDKGDNDNFDITIQYANTTQISGGSSEEGGKNGSQIVENITVEAPTIYSAVGLANHIVSKTFSLSHAKLIVFSQEIAEEGLSDIIETFIRSEELRPDVNLAVAPDGANEYLIAVNPVMEVNPAKYYQMIYDKNSLIGVPDGAAKNFFFGIESGDYDCILPIAGVISGEKEQEGGDSGEGGGSATESTEGGGSEGNSGGSSAGDSETENENQKDAPLNEGRFEYKMKDYVGGQASVEQKNKSEAIGGAVFSKDKMVGVLGSIETELFKLILGDYKNSYLTFYNEDTPDDPVTVKAIQERRTKYKVNCNNKTVDVEMFIEGDVYSLPANYNIEANIVKFEDKAREYIENASQKFMTEFIGRYDSDIFRIKEKAKREFLTIQDFNNYKESVDLKDYKINVKANFKIRRTGLIVRENK
ncbi:hypothetical protein FMM68_01470 [Lachnospiraceae bacterium MD329]|nr:hypothetical protein [Lachnospiraceae bacterium MD329]